MNLFSKEHLENLFEQIGSVQVPECDTHRYALRRMLLNSKYFHEHQISTRRRAMLLMPVVASGFFVAVLFVTSHPQSATDESLGVNQSFVMTDTFEPGFLTEGLSATFVDDRPIIPVSYQANTVTFSTAAMALKID